MGRGGGDSGLARFPGCACTTGWRGAGEGARTSTTALGLRCGGAVAALPAPEGEEEEEESEEESSGEETRGELAAGAGEGAPGEEEPEEGGGEEEGADEGGGGGSWIGGRPA